MTTSEKNAMKLMNSQILGGALVVSLLSAPAANAEENHADLAKQLSNPVANLVSVPFQFNWDTGIGPKIAIASF